MSVFDDNDIEIINQENKMKSDDEKKRLDDELLKRKVACKYIMTCLDEFPDAAKKVNLKTKKIMLRSYVLFKSIDFDRAVNAWELSSGLFIDSRGVCYIKNKKNAGTSISVATEEMAMELYKVIRYKLDLGNQETIQKNIKKVFLNVLSGRSLQQDC